MSEKAIMDDMMEKLPYETPILIEFGDMKALTYAAGGSGGDGMMSFGGDPSGQGVKDTTGVGGPQFDGSPVNAVKKDDAGPGPGDDTTGRPADT